MRSLRSIPFTVLLLAWACAPAGEQGAAVDLANACPTAVPPSGLNPETDPDAARAYGRLLNYHPAQHPYGQTRDLTIISQPGNPQQRRFRLDANVAIEPETCSHLNDAGDLATGAGRIVARLTTNRAYPKLGLRQGVSYLWVDNLDAVNGTARAFLIPEPAGRPWERTIRYRANPPNLQRTWAEARLVFTPADDEVWESCAKFGCCYLEEGQPGDSVPPGPN